MNSITKRTVALAISVAALAAAATPSLAQTRSQRAVHPQQMQEPYVGTQQFGNQYPVPNYVRNPYECWSDEGNGRYTSCDNGSS